MRFTPALRFLWIEKNLNRSFPHLTVPLVKSLINQKGCFVKQMNGVELSAIDPPAFELIFRPYAPLEPAPMSGVCTIKVFCECFKEARSRSGRRPKKLNPNLNPSARLPRAIVRGGKVTSVVRVKVPPG